LDQQQIYNLLQKYRDNTATEAEKQALIEWYREIAYQDSEFPGDEHAVGEGMLNRLMKEVKPKRKIISIKQWYAAASIIVIVGSGILFILRLNHKPIKNLAAAIKNDVTPGGEKAILTLANGSKISLTDARNGNIARQAGVQIAKATNGQLIYTINASNASPVTGATGRTGNAETLAYNTISTPIGGQYQVILPDGSKVWLNAMSSIKFPVSFSTLKERRIELSGEAYFEVEHDKEHPFKVITTKQEVEDLGTQFDVSAYADEAVTKTTLLGGSVKITAGNNTSLLKPGQQAKLINNITVAEVNTQAVIAWKNGYFMFDDERLEDVMRQVSRWYNIKVVYTDENLKNETFGALSTRFANISILLNMMEQTGNVHFKINGSTITVSGK
jgi:transmembrane sensor